MKRRILLPLILIFCLLFTLTTYCTSLAGWDKRIKLTVDQTKIDTADLTWFPVTITLSSAAGHGVFHELDADADYMKVAFTKADGTTELYAEMELFDVSEETAVYHVSLDGWVISNTVDTDFFMYYDNDHADNTTYIGAINTTAGAAVWDGNFKFVCHMVDATTSTVLDSTSNNNDGTKKSAAHPASATGKVSLGQDFVGSATDYITAATSATFDFAAGFTLEMLADPDSTDAFTILLSYYDATSKDGYNIYQYTDGAGNWLFQTRVNTVDKSIASNSAPTGAFDHIVGRRDADGVMLMYINGVVQTATQTNAGAIDSNSKLYLGINYDEASVPYAGIMDEVRISNTARTAEWIKATYNSLWNTLLTYGTEDFVGGNAVMFGINF